jgi:hypothetical protein
VAVCAQVRVLLDASNSVQDLNERFLARWPHTTPVVGFVWGSFVSLSHCTTKACLPLA